VGETLVACAQKAGEPYGFKIRLDSEYSIADSWAGTHWNNLFKGAEDTCTDGLFLILDYAEIEIEPLFWPNVNWPSLAVPMPTDHLKAAAPSLHQAPSHPEQPGPPRSGPRGYGCVYGPHHNTD
jgi:hypothetical protein